MTAYAHTHPDHPNDSSKWEPLFTPFGDEADECQRESCEKCRDLSPDHGHLNKVAWWSAKFASEMFAPDSTEAKSAWDWGYLAGLWHDVGKFAPKWQSNLIVGSHFWVRILPAKGLGAPRCSSAPCDRQNRRLRQEIILRRRLSNTKSELPRLTKLTSVSIRAPRERGDARNSGPSLRLEQFRINRKFAFFLENSYKAIF